MPLIETIKSLGRLYFFSNLPMSRLYVILMGSVFMAVGDSLFIFGLYAYLRFLSSEDFGAFEKILVYISGEPSVLKFYLLLLAMITFAFFLRSGALLIHFFSLEMIKKNISDSMVSKYLAAPLSIGKKIDAASFTKLLTTDVDLILFNGYQQLTVGLQNFLLVLIVFLGLGSVYPNELVATTFVLLGFYLVLFKLVRNRVGLYSSGVKENNSKRGTLLNDIARTLRETKILSLEALHFRSFSETTKQLFLLNSKSSFLGAFPKVVLETFVLSSFVLLTIFLSATGRASAFEVVLAFGVSAFRLLPACQAIYTASVNLRLVSFTVHSFENQFKLLRKEKASKPFKIKSTQTGENTYSIVFKDVSSKSEDGVLFDSFNASVVEGQLIKITGPSGSGKSTLVDGLIGFNKFETGIVEIAANNGSLPRFGYVSQKPAFFSGSIEQNLLFDRLDETGRAKTQLLTKELGVDQLLNRKSYEELSGGQLQRVGIIRALSLDADIYIFDEALSALDRNTSNIVKVILMRELKGKTIFWISHTDEFDKEAAQIWTINPEHKRIRVKKNDT